MDEYLWRYVEFILLSADNLVHGILKRLCLRNGDRLRGVVVEPAMGACRGRAQNPVDPTSAPDRAFGATTSDLGFDFLDKHGAFAIFAWDNLKIKVFADPLLAW